MGSQLSVLTESEAAVLVARQPAAAVPSSAAADAVPAPFHLQLQQPPFRLKPANKGLNLSTTHATAAVLLQVSRVYRVAPKTAHFHLLDVKLI